MSDKKKTQKQLIEDLTLAMEKLSRRIEILERNANPYEWNPKPRTRTKDCSHCNGTGKVEVNHPFQPYYSNDNYNGSSWGV
jgi:hypothetical protein